MKVIHETELEGKLVKGEKGSVVLKDAIDTPNLVAGIRIIAPDSDIPSRPHKHEEFQLVYVISGTTTVFNGTETRELKPGDFVEFDAEEEHYFTNGTENVILFEVKWK